MLQIPFLTEIAVSYHLYLLKRRYGVLNTCIYRTRNDAWKIYLKHSQSASASGGLFPQAPYWGFAPGPCWGPRPLLPPLFPAVPTSLGEASVLSCPCLRAPMHCMRLIERFGCPCGIDNA